MSGWYAAPMKVTISFRDDALYRAVRVRAAEEGRQIRDVVEEALTAWLDAREEVEDAAASTAALREYEEGGGEDADAVFRRMVAEGHVQYDDS
jgi:plasmid stability protein